jgi:hypothetical protein
MFSHYFYFRYIHFHFLPPVEAPVFDFYDHLRMLLNLDVVD